MVSITIMVFIALAKCKYKIPEYDPTAESAVDPEQVPVVTESET